jgi:hypothetical protein
LLDRYLARNGYDSQQYDGPEDPHRLDNLWERLPGDHGTHGDFDSRAARRSPQTWLNLHRGWLVVADALLIVTVLDEFVSRRLD